MGTQVHHLHIHAMHFEFTYQNVDNVLKNDLVLVKLMVSGVGEIGVGILQSDCQDLCQSVIRLKIQ